MNFVWKAAWCNKNWQLFIISFWGCFLSRYVPSFNFVLIRKCHYTYVHVFYHTRFRCEGFWFIHEFAIEGSVVYRITIEFNFRFSNIKDYLKRRGRLFLEVFANTHVMISRTWMFRWYVVMGDLFIEKPGWVPWCI